MSKKEGWQLRKDEHDNSQMHVYIPLLFLLAAFLSATAEPKQICYSVKKPGKVSIGIYNQDGVLVRQIVSGKRKEAGKYSITWDGLDDDKKPVVAGSYQWRGVIVLEDYRIVYDGTIGNTGVPSYSTKDDYKRSEHRAGSWADVAVDAQDNMYWISSNGEGDPLMQKAGPDGEVVWGAKGGCAWPFSTLGWAVTVDRGNVFVVQPSTAPGGGKEKVSWGICRLDNKGELKRKSNPIIYERRFTVEQARDIAERTRMTIPQLVSVPVRKIEAKAGKVYVPLYFENRIDIYDGESLTVLNSVDKVERPQDLAVGQAGEFYVLSDKTVKRYSASWKLEKTVVDGLGAGWAIAVDRQGNIYVVDLGPSQQVKVFSREGKQLRTIGRKGGGFDYGKVTPEKLAFPSGVAVDGKGNIIIAEYGNDRIQKIDPGGNQLLSIMSGVYFDAVFPDEEHPEILWNFGSNCFRQYRVNYEKRTWELERFWRVGFEEHGRLRDFTGEGYGSTYLRYLNGTPYIFVCFGAPKILRVDGDRLLPVALMGGGKGKRNFWKDNEGWVEKSPGKTWTWSDLDRDGYIEEAELTLYDKDYSEFKLAGVTHGSYVDEKGTMYLRYMGTDDTPSKVFKFSVAGFNKNGDPYFSWDKVEKIWELPKEHWWKSYAAQGNTMDAKGNVYVICIAKDWYKDFTTANVQAVNVMKYDRENKRVWKVGRKMGLQKDEPGELGLPTFFAGIQDGLVYVGDVTGQLDVWTEDGLYVATLLEDGNTNPNPPSYYRSRGEQWIGYLFRHKGNGKMYYYTAPNAMCAIRRYEIGGADSLMRISGKLEVLK